jgi:hypothetical protein
MAAVQAGHKLWTIRLPSMADETVHRLATDPQGVSNRVWHEGKRFEFSRLGEFSRVSAPSTTTMLLI